MQIHSILFKLLFLLRPKTSVFMDVPFYFFSYFLVLLLEQPQLIHMDGHVNTIKINSS